MDESMKTALAEAIGGAVKAAFAEAIAETKAPAGGDNGAKLFAPAVNRGAEPSPLVDGVGRRHQIASFVKWVAVGRGDPERAAKAAEKAGDAFMAKRLVSTDFSAGGSLVPQEMLTEFFAALRPMAVVRGLVERTWPMERGTLVMPGITGGATARYRGEGAATRATTVQTGDIRLTEKLMMATIPISNQLIRATAGAAEAAIMQDLIAEVARVEDLNFIDGDGTEGKPLGIRRQMDPTHSTAGTSASVTLPKIDADLAAIRKQVKAANVNLSAGAYLMNTDVEEDLMKLRSGDVKAYPEMEAGQRVGRYRYGASNNVPSGVIMFGNAADIIIADSENFRVAVSEEAAYVDAAGTVRSAFSEDMTVMRVTMGHDIALRYRRAWAEKTAVNYATLT